MKMKMEDYIAILRSGTENWNRWRKEKLEFVAPEAHHRHMKQEYLTFQGADLRKLNLAGAELSFVSFRGADLRDSDLSSANCMETVFLYARLSRVNFANANLTGAEFNQSLEMWAKVSGLGTAWGVQPGLYANIYAYRCELREQKVVNDLLS